MEYHSFLHMKMMTLTLSMDYQFPSPYGVSFILTEELGEFNDLYILKVSVSLWSIIHSYVQRMENQTCDNFKTFPSPYGVSFILTHLSLHFQ